MNAFAQKMQLAAAGLVAVAFAVGICALFQLRFQRGDIYPAYSSLRADPLGTKAFYESLDGYADLNVRRGTKSFDQLKDIRGATVLNLGTTLSPFMWEKRILTDLRHFIHDGGRLVITFAPVDSDFFTQGLFEGDAPKNATSATNDTPNAVQDDASDTNEMDQADQTDGAPGEQDEGDKTRSRFLRQSQAWGVTNVLTAKDTDRVAHRHSDAPHSLPATVSSRTRLAFGTVNKDWNVLYTMDDRPVLLERRMGRGTVVLSSLSYFLSNEAMKDERHASLLSWLIGEHTTIVFDEYIHGVVHRSGIAALGRKYRLHALFAGLLLLSALFIWRSLCPLVPPPDRVNPRSGSAVSIGRGSESALVNLLRRNIPERDILSACYREWKRCQGHRRLDHGVRNAIAAVFKEERTKAPRLRRPAAAYNALCACLNKSPVAKTVLKPSPSTHNVEPKSEEIL